MLKPAPVAIRDQLRAMVRVHSAGAILEALGAVLLEPPAPNPVTSGQFERAKLAGYDVEPDGFRGGWRARDPEGDELPGPDGVGEDPHPTERAAWEACDRHRMFGSAGDE